MERPRGVNCIRPGGGSALCTLHPGEGLYGQVRYRGYMRDSPLETLSGIVHLHRRDCTGMGPSSITSSVVYLTTSSNYLLTGRGKCLTTDIQMLNNTVYCRGNYLLVSLFCIREFSNFFVSDIFPARNVLIRTFKSTRSLQVLNEGGGIRPPPTEADFCRKTKINFVIIRV